MHTPGPWTADRAPGPTDRRWRVAGPVAPGVSEQLAVVNDDLLRGDDGTPEANARLMAAAPALLAACEAVIEHAYTRQPCPGWSDKMQRALQQARAAIAKAKPDATT